MDLEAAINGALGANASIASMLSVNNNVFVWDKGGHIYDYGRCLPDGARLVAVVNHGELFWEGDGR